MADGSSLFGLSQRLPPSNIQAEQSLLGAILANNRAYERVADFLLPHHFSDPVHGQLYQAMAERILDGRLADAVSMKHALENSGVLDPAGGFPYLATLLASMVGIINAGEYGTAIVDSWMRRNLIDIGETIVNRAFGVAPGTDAKAQIELAIGALDKLGTDQRGSDRMVSIGAAVSGAIARAQAIYSGKIEPAVFSGMQTVDRAFGGFWAEDLILLAGLPGAGKTALAVQIAFSAAKKWFDDAVRDGATPEQAENRPGIVLWSLEMGPQALGARVAAYRAGISVEDLLSGRLDMEKALRLRIALAECQHLPLRIRDGRRTGLKLLPARIRRHLRQTPERLCIVDHLLVKGDEQTDGRFAGNDVATVQQTVWQLQRTAVETHLPLIVLTHASRASSRTGQRPTQADIKWAGEGTADVLAFVHRPIQTMDTSPPARGARESDEAYERRKNRWHQEQDDSKNLAEIVIAKRRQGPTGVFRMRFNGATTSFSEWSSGGQDDLGEP